MFHDKEIEDMGPDTFKWIRTRIPLDLCSLLGKQTSHACYVLDPCTLISSQP